MAASWRPESRRWNDLDRILDRRADSPVLDKLAPKRTTATRLGAQACRFIYAQAFNDLDIGQFSASERRWFNALKRKE